MLYFRGRYDCGSYPGVLQRSGYEVAIALSCKWSSHIFRVGFVVERGGGAPIPSKAITSLLIQIGIVLMAIEVGGESAPDEG